MLNLISKFKGPKELELNDNNVLTKSHSSLGQKISSTDFFFQQDIVEEIRTHQHRKTPTQDSVDLSSTVCAGTCYWTALKLLGIDNGSIAEFIEDIYQKDNGIKHPHGVNHVNFIKYLGNKHHSFYGLSINPFREHSPDKFIVYGGYSGKAAERFFRKVYKSIKDTASLSKLIIENGGLAITSIQSTFNNYSPDFHDILILGYDKPSKSFIFLDPDARTFFDTQRIRPKQVKPISKHRGLFTVSADYLNKNTYREKPSPGGIVIGLFSHNSPKPPTPKPPTSHSH